MQERITVNTAKTLERAQTALTIGRRLNDTSLIAASESVMSALVLVLKSTTADIPAELRPHLELIDRMFTQ
jgi:hypothetical protein